MRLYIISALLKFGRMAKTMPHLRRFCVKGFFYYAETESDFAKQAVCTDYPRWLGL